MLKTIKILEAKIESLELEKSKLPVGKISIKDRNRIGKHLRKFKKALELLNNLISGKEKETMNHFLQTYEYILVNSWNDKYFCTFMEDINKENNTISLSLNYHTNSYEPNNLEWLEFKSLFNFNGFKWNKYNKVFRKIIFREAGFCISENLICSEQALEKYVKEIKPEADKLVEEFSNIPSELQETFEEKISIPLTENQQELVANANLDLETFTLFALNNEKRFKTFSHMLSFAKKAQKNYEKYGNGKKLEEIFYI